MYKARTYCLVIAAALLPALVPASAMARVRFVPERHALPRPAADAQFRMIAEFEQQQGVLVGWEPEDQSVQQAILDIIRAASPRVQVVMLVADETEERSVSHALIDAGISRHAVRFIHLATDTIWARDFGPMVLSGPAGQFHFLDAGYGDSDRTSDDAVPAELGRILGVQSVETPLYLDGGNLLSNGAGLVLTTRATVDRNDDGTFGPQDLQNVLQEYYGARQLVVLEPLMGEPTGHVDMFATFVSQDTVVVGQYSRADDPLNAEILDRNADRLSKVHTRNGPLRVVRIPMPPHDSVLWPSYTNVLFANGVLLLPVYPQIDPVGVARAVAMYRQLLPGWRIARIDCSTLIELGGAVHCVTMNLPRLPDLQQKPLPRERPVGHLRIARTETHPHWQWKQFGAPAAAPPMFSTRDSFEFDEPEGTLPALRRGPVGGFPESPWQPRESPVRGPRLLDREGKSYRNEEWQPARKTTPAVNRLRTDARMRPARWSLPSEKQVETQSRPSTSVDAPYFAPVPATPFSSNPVQAESGWAPTITDRTASKSYSSADPGTSVSQQAGAPAAGDATEPAQFTSSSSPVQPFTRDRSSASLPMFDKPMFGSGSSGRPLLPFQPGVR
ncbi:MAG: agmatine deiminase family protein [Planctomycetaceae bacterium]|nr:agmatine deiminase family protein [Planctomycetaceae bacterium]